jgi:hypothetical protein
MYTIRSSSKNPVNRVNRTRRLVHNNYSNSKETIGTRKSAEKFISYYWPQVRPYAGKVLRQNTGNMLAVISALGRIAERGIVG